MALMSLYQDLELRLYEIASTPIYNLLFTEASGNKRSSKESTKCR